jgi:hypothetical protein
MRRPTIPVTIRIVPIVWISIPSTLPLTAKRRIAPTAVMNIAAPMVTIGEYMPRFWIYMQVVIVVCVLISSVIAIVKLS